MNKQEQETTEYIPFKLDRDFVAKYKTITPNFGFNGLGEVVYQRTYSRIKDDGEKEQWFETVERVVDGLFNMQKRYLEGNNEAEKFNSAEAQRKAQVMYEKIFEFKFLPPGRGLWALGTKITEEKKIYAALNNCAFVSTEQTDPELFVKSFAFLMDMLMLGVGVGFDTKGKGKFLVYKPLTETEKYVVPDSREGWTDSTLAVLRTYLFPNKPQIECDYSQIRPEGQVLKTFGGISPGPEPLKFLHAKIREVFGKLVGENVTSRAIVDIMNLIGKCVVSGNVRRSAEIAFGSTDDEEFLSLKDYEKNPDRAEFGWTSNNSIYAELGMDYTKVAEKTKVNGEPGIIWLENMQKYSRMADAPDYKDKKATGGNPCMEQTLESFEMCCLVETFPNNHRNLEEYLETLEYAFLYAKVITLGMSHWEETNKIIQRNRRIGCSMSGIAQFLGNHGFEALKQWCDQGYQFLKSYDAKISEFFGVNQSIKITSIKPSGTVSLLAGATPGVHFPQSKYYIRRIRVSKNDSLLQDLKKKGYKMEQCHYTSDSMVIEIPVALEENTKTLNDVTMWEQLELAAFLQKYWADNQVSCTITFDQEKEGHEIPKALEYFQYQLKGISFLPQLKSGKTIYVQLPYEEITKDQFIQMMEDLKHNKIEIDTNERQYVNYDSKDTLYCDGETCLMQAH